MPLPAMEDEEAMRALDARCLTSENAFSKRTVVQLCRVSPEYRRGFITNSVLFDACRGGQHEMAKALLKCGADRMARDAKQRIPLHHAACHGRLSCVTLLLKRMTPAEVNATSQIGCTALHFAAQNGHEKVCGVLIEAGAQLDVRDVQGHTPLFVALINQPTITVLHALLSGRRLAHPPGTVCDQCGKTAAQAAVNSLKGCEQCGTVRYCGAACQLAAWPGHKARRRARRSRRRRS